ncbi:hypothetical protein PV646_19085 [Streptomyces sp. ID05-26A]|nr:hypothetical protein [Streptomyces sp. ID05-26A]
MSKPTRAGLLALQSAAGNRAMSKLLSVQRNVGIELEDPKWSVFAGSPEQRERVEKSTPVVPRSEFELQAEDGQNGSVAEIVSRPPGVTDQRGLDALLAQIDETIGELNVRSDEIPFSADELKGGLSGFWLCSYSPFKPDLQMTVGVPLSRIPALKAALKAGRRVDVDGPDVESSAETARQVLNAVPSPELVGLIDLIRSYLGAGDRTGGALMLKELTKVMARTDFATLFSMLPEQEQRVIRAHQDRWVDVLVRGLRTGGDHPAGASVFNQAVNFNDRGMAFQYRNITSRRAWLEGMSQGGVDLMSAGGKAGALKDTDRARALESGIKWTKPEVWRRPVDAERLLAVLEEIHEGLGALGSRTDHVAYHDEGGKKTPAAILELRAIDQGLPWRDTVQMVFDCVQQVNGFDGGRPFTNVAADRHETGEPEGQDIAVLQWGRARADDLGEALAPGEE